MEHGETASSATISVLHCLVNPVIVIAHGKILMFVMIPCVFCVRGHNRRTLTQRTVIWPPLPPHRTTDKQPSRPPAEPWSSN